MTVGSVCSHSGQGFTRCEQECQNPGDGVGWLALALASEQLKSSNSWGAVMSNALLLLAHSYLIKNTSHRKYPVIPPRPPPGGSFERSRGKDHQSQNQKGNMHYCHPCLAICFAVLQVLADSDNDTATARETAPALQAKHSSIISD